jgi:LysM repeat protein
MKTASTYTVVSGDSLYAIARRFGMTIDELKALNRLTSNVLSVGQRLQVMVDAPSPGWPSAGSSSPAGTGVSYTVVRGDTLSGIARRFNTTVEEIKRLNGLTSNTLSVGQRLRVGGSQAPSGPSGGDPAPPSTATAGYTVAPGDTLFGIASRFNTTVDELKRLNALTSTALSVGQRIKVPGRPATPEWNDNPPPPPVVVYDPTPALDVQGARRQFALEVRPDVGCNRYLLTVPLLNGNQVVAQMRDNVTISRYMIYPQGILYPGMADFPLEVGLIESVGLTPPQARALQYVSTHEGKYDAINSYDKGLFSYGFVQFVAASESGASLNRVLHSMKAYAPTQFDRIFQRLGIYSEGGQTVVVNDYGGKLRGDDAWKFIQRTVRLYAPFIQAGFEPILVREQLRIANLMYIQPALNFKLNLTVNGIALRIPRLQDIISSEALLTAVIAIAVNRGVGGMSKIVGDAISAVAAQNRLHDPAAIKRVDERQVCETIVAQSTDERVHNRAQGVLSSGLSFAKV